MENLKLETINEFSGYGANGNKQGEHFYSRNMSAIDGGIVSAWHTYNLVDETVIPSLKLITEYAQGNGGMYMIQDENGYILYSDSGTFAPELVHDSAENVAGYSGIITDPKGRIVYAGIRYIGLYDPDDSNYDTGTISVTNGSMAIVGSGTTFTSAMVGKMIKVDGDAEIFYKVATYTDATHITISSNYGGTTASGVSYIINTAWDDTEWDLGADYNCDKIMETFEDWVFIGYENKIAGINTTDDSFNTTVFDLPTGFEIVAIKYNTSGVLVGANNDAGESISFLWDGISDRSTSEWTWHKGEVRAIQNYGQYYVLITTQGYFITSGYSYKALIDSFPDNAIEYGSAGFIPESYTGVIIQGDKMFMSCESNGCTRSWSGITIFNLKTLLFENASYPSNSMTDVNIGAIGFYIEGSRSSIFISYGEGSNIAIGKLRLTTAENAHYVTKPLGTSTPNIKSAEGLKLSLSLPTRYWNGNYEKTFNISAKIYDYTRQYTGYCQITADSTELDKITINDSTYTASWANIIVGDEITILEGNASGDTRNVIAITGAGTTTREITLDRDLSGLPESSDNVVATPFKLIKRFVLNDIEKFIDLYFPISGLSVGKKFLVKIMIEDAELPISLDEIHFFYTDKGYL